MALTIAIVADDGTAAVEGVVAKEDALVMNKDSNVFSVNGFATKAKHELSVTIDSTLSLTNA